MSEFCGYPEGVSRFTPSLVLLLAVSSCGRGGFLFGNGDGVGNDAPTSPFNPIVDCTLDDADACSDAGLACGTFVTRNCNGRVIVCGTCTWPDVCSDEGSCGHDVWFTAGESAIGDIDTRSEWGSAAGGGVSQVDNAALFDLTSDADGTPVIAWGAPDGLFVQYFDGAVWRGRQNAVADRVASGLFDTTGRSFSRPGMFGRDAANRLVLVAAGQWDAGDFSIRAVAQTPTGWIQMGSDLPAAMNSPSVAYDAAGHLLVSYTARFGTNTRIAVVRWSGTSWVEFSPGSASGGGISTTQWDDYSSIALDQNGSPCVSWMVVLDGTGLRVRCWDGASWAQIGSSDTTSIATVMYLPSPIVMLAPMDPLILTSSSDVFAHRYSGGMWTSERPFVRSGAVARGTDQSLTRLANGQTAVVFTDEFDYTLHASVFNGSTWSWLPSEADIAGTSGATSPRMLETSPGRYIAAWSDFANGTNAVYTKVFDGSTWAPQLAPTHTSTGGVSTAGATARVPAITVNADRTIDVMFSQDDATVLRRFDQNTSTWATVDGPWAGVAATPRMTRLTRADDGRVRAYSGSSNRLYVGDDAGGWTSSDQLEASDVLTTPSGESFMCRRGRAMSLEVLRLAGTTWTAVGAPLMVATMVGTACSLTHDGSQLLVTWTENPSGFNRVHVARFDGSSWQGLGDSMTADGIFRGTDYSAVSPLIAYVAELGPVVMWRARSTNINDLRFYLYSARFDGSTWVELGSGGFSGTAVTSSLVTSHVLAVDATRGTLYVAARASNGVVSSDIHVYRYRGSAWAELPTPLQYGISNSNTPSLEPSMSARDGLVCVAWVEQAGTMRVALRCTQD